MLELTQVTLKGEHGPILKGVDIIVKPGEAVALVGKAGSGRSAVLAIASGALQAQEGRVRYERREQTRRPLDLRKHTGLSTPELMGPYELSVESWLSYWANAQGLGEARETIEYALNAFGLTGVRAHLVAQLSHTHRRCLDLARLRVLNPKIYLLDHPCAFLDGVSFWNLTRELNTLKRQGHGLLIASNEYNLASRVCDRAVLIEAGDSVEECPSTSPRYQDFIRRSLGWTS